MATPSVPQRPARSQNLPTASASIDMPRIPPRPKRNVERSISPQRESFARSPLNDLSFHPKSSHGSSNLRKMTSRDLPPRPPSVNLPLIGDEGNEYAHLDTPDAEAQQSNPMEQTKIVAGDLPLHAPKASLPATTAKTRIAAVTRTDSSQAAALGIGKATSESDSHSQFGSNLARSTSSEASRSRPASLYKHDTHEQSNEDLGIPEIGLQVPMYPNAGDVQAPTPSPSVHPPTSSGIGFHNSGSGLVAGRDRHHSRTKSGREVFTGPPGSYGLHGHGVIAKDPLEKAWYDKHPDVMAREAKGEYGPAIAENRKEYALSSEELNKLVHAKALAMVASHPALAGTPDEQIGFLASEEYASRMNSPRPSSTKPRRPSSQTHAESPLRKMSFPAHEIDVALKKGDSRSSHDQALESEAEEDVIHVDPPSRSISKIGGGGYDPPTQDLGPHGGNTDAEGGYVVETGYGVPILASDEIMHRPEAQYMQPAVDPEMERRGSTYFGETDTPPSGRRSATHSRSNSIPTITHSMARFANDDREGAGTPLEDVKEYEPLFPEDDELQELQRSKTAPAGGVEKLKRPDVLARHHFPSQDVWEDTPSSLMYQTTVETPQLPDESSPSAEHEPKTYFETPEAEEARKSNLTKSDKQEFIPDSTKRFAKTGLKKGVLSELPERPGMRQRFPSQDIWEDTPDSHMYTTTVDNEQEKEEEAANKVPQIPSRPTKKTSNGDKETSPVEERKAPSIPGRLKPAPKVPARPSKLQSRWSEEEVPLSKSNSKGSADGESSAVKAKPPVPARPAGGKIAALQASFMNDLNKRLQVGPVAPKKEESKEEEAVEEKAPLTDARKGRARGPQRRKPSVSPSASSEEPASVKKSVAFAISKPQTIWEVDEAGAVSVPSSDAVAQSEPLKEPEVAESSKPDVVESPPPIEPSVSEERAPEVASTSTSTATETEEPEKEREIQAPTKSSSTDSAVQTGQQDLSITSDTATGEKDKTTVYLGGRAPEPGSVTVTSDGVEHIGNPDGLGGIERTGKGM